MGARLREPYYLALLAEARGKAGQVEEGLSLLAEALEVVHESDERCYAAELHRFTGELLLMQGEAEDKVERRFHRAFEIARKRSAKPLELRAAMSLCRWRQTQGEKARALKLLEETYDRFTEGFDTIDLRKAKALLEKLA
jgi:predicted ATPase